MNMYQIVDSKIHQPVKTGFDTREAAKPARDKLNGGPPTEDKPGRYIVSRGEDHPLGASNGISRKTLGRNSRWL